MKLIARWQFWLLIVLVLLGCGLRLYGLNWDAGDSFHPDERQILFHVTSLGWPTSWAEFVNPALSPLNPQFFAYGSFPIYLLAVIGRVLGYNLHDATNFFPLTLVGRVVSAIFDSGTILVTACLAGVLARKTKQLQSQAWSVALLAAALLAFTPLHLQLSHFYAVDTLLAFFVVLTVFFCVLWVDSPRPFLWALLAGVSYGLAMATKFSAAPLVLPLLCAAWLRWQRYRRFFDLALALFGAAILMMVAFFGTQPYALLDMPAFIKQVSDQGNLARGTLDLPYVRQFAGTLPFIYQGQNLLLWGMGIGAGTSALIGCGWLAWLLWRNWQSSWLIVLLWVLVYSIIVGSFFVKFMRYLLPVYPFLIVIASAFVIVLSQRIRWWKWPALERMSWLKPCLQVIILLFVLGGTMFQGLALLNVYSEPNTRIQASNWIYQHIAPGSVLTYEQWDDALPFPVGKHTPDEYKQATYTDVNGQPTTGLDLYGDDTQAKAQQLANLLPTVEAITMPTDRLDKSIPRSPGRYPLTIRYYQLLFSGQLGFHLAAQFENHPHLFGITLDDSNADESYSVFDHPTARIFVRDPHYPYTPQQLLAKLTSGLRLPDK
ncbi:glycosyltransferase family 39 protein [Dictyobacter aurantiacus]|uniref:Glycosyltransferase RgtA/B/C/D-like domain-containing protein n=1 Tax=Dictyobacter aurantiacus TaxID=1936993 RepID=A0A401ZA87_9CHLR|nr:glycosyltransferase family 39 protein [Dictyobacter aurantiacus]GCE03777.1 hypothetical protein KDAU_11060 [Dictyobacter aurantiacus]